VAPIQPSQDGTHLVTRIYGASITKTTNNSKKQKWHKSLFLIKDKTVFGSVTTLIMEWSLKERRKRGRPRKTRMEGVQAAMTVRNLEQDQLRNREEWRLVSIRQGQLL
jgi:hypothetical protein